MNLNELFDFYRTKIPLNLSDSIALTRILIDESVSIGPKDYLSRITYYFNNIATSILTIVLIPIIPFSTFGLGLIVMLTFSLFLLVISFIWMIFLILLISSSWLWIKFWILRPLLILPGLIIAITGSIYCSLMPDMGEKYQKILKMSLCESWPYSYTLLSISKNNYIE